MCWTRPLSIIEITRAVARCEYTNTEADIEAIDREAEAIADEFQRLMSTSTYKGKDIFITTAGSEYVSMGGRDAEMTLDWVECNIKKCIFMELLITLGYEWVCCRNLTTTTIMKGSSYDVVQRLLQMLKVSSQVLQMMMQPMLLEKILLLQKRRLQMMQIMAVSQININS